MAERSISEGTETKQALLINNNGFDAKFAKIFAFSVLTYGIVNTTMRCVLMGTPILSAIIPNLWIVIPALVTNLAYLATHHIMRNRLAKKLENALEKIGYAVTSVKKIGVDQFYEAMDRLKDSAGPSTTTIVCYSGHGCAQSPDSSSVNMGDMHMRDENFVNKLLEIQGNNALIVSACCAGGFAEAAKNAGNNDNVVVVTNTNMKIRRGDGADMERLMIKIAKNRQDAPFVSHVSELNSKKSLMKKINGFEPRVFCGKKMANFRV